MAARPSWQGHLKLSLVTCPVALYNAISPRGDVHFNMINPATGNRIRMITVDAGTEEPVERKGLVKGYEIAKGEYVIVTQEEIDSVKLESTKTIEIESFVPAADIDRLYWDNPYYLVPDGKMAAEPFAVIREAMERAGQIALGRVVMSSRERLVALEPRDRGVVATTLRSHEEVRAMKDYFADIPAIRPDPEMIAIAAKIISQKEADFDPSEFKDHYEEALRELIERKQKGHKVTRTDEPAESNVINLMDALKASLKGDAAKPKKAEKADKPSKPTPAPKKRAKR
ncbi:MAG: Ku protein [Alphaproteobacteria bacterium]|nr:Ku protein [Alphaproteobacteria bacterium]